VDNPCTEHRRMMPSVSINFVLNSSAIYFVHLCKLHIHVKFHLNILKTLRYLHLQHIPENQRNWISERKDRNVR
ncbi:hypothetical protein L9F63_017778, partial [Diploptera punctata]